MTTILMQAEAFDRLEGELSEVDPTLEFVLMQPDGSVTRDGQTIPITKARPDIAWLNVGIARAKMTQTYVDLVLRTQSVKWLQTFNTGLDHPFYKDLFAAGLRISNSNAQAISISEYVLTHVLAHFQNIWQRQAQQQAHHWERVVFREMWRSRWLLVGFGNIGQALARRLRAFECQVIGVRRSAQPHSLADNIITRHQLAEVLPTVDVVVIACTLTQETTGLVDRTFLQQMKPDAVLVNVARGRIIDQVALLDALKAKTIEHAILDVFPQEPLPQDSPLWDMPNVTVTSHTSNSGHNTALRGDLLFLDNLRRYLANEPLLTEVTVQPV